MRKWLMILCIALLLGGCSFSADEAAENVREQLRDFPTSAEFVKMDDGERLQFYDRLQRLYGAFRELTPLQRMQIPDAEEQLRTYFDWFQAEPVSGPVPVTVPETEVETVPETIVETVPETTEETVPETVPETTAETVPETVPETTAPVVMDLSEEDQVLLLRLGMAERGESECVTCIALVMRTVLNRVEGGFGSTVRKVIYAQEQFRPAMDGSLEEAQPNDDCREALDMVMRGWDESGGALFYEWVEGETWHSRSLKLTVEHCGGQFYKR